MSGLANLVGVELGPGTNHARFPAPVPSWSSLRGRFSVLDVEATSRGARATIEATVECDRVDKPACGAQLVVLSVS